MGTRFGFVSTYPPTQCGLATFAAALRGALLHDTGDEGWVVRLVEAQAPQGTGDEAVTHLVAGRPASLAQAAERLNQCDVAIVQHEYGIYGGHDGAEILSLLDEVSDDFANTARSHPLDEQVVGSRGGKSYTFTRGGVITHVTTHGMHHRAQCLNMLRQMGIAPLPPSAVVEWILCADSKA